MLKEDCPYYPCHKGAMHSCDFCYCPLYEYADCGGSYIILSNGLKDCSNCMLPHDINSHRQIPAKLAEKINKDDSDKG